MRPTWHVLRSILPFIYPTLDSRTNSKKEKYAISMALVLFLCSYMSYAQTDLLDTSTWTVGQGSVSGFYRKGTDAENIRELGTNPHGQSEVLWKAVPDGNVNADGGWDSDYQSIDHSKTYRLSVWIKNTNSHDGETYFGLFARDASGGHATLELNGTLHTNPYFFWGDLPQLDQWYLLVGYVRESSYSLTTSLGGIYDMSGNKVVDLIDFKFSAATTHVQNRAYLYYDTNTADRQYFWGPTIYEINGQEPTIQELVNGTNASDTQAPTAPTLSSTGQSATTVDISWTGATDNTAVTAYKVFKNAVLEATLGNVNTYTVTGLTASTGYAFTVTALDAANNESTASTSVSVTTSGSGGSSGNWVQSGSGLQYTTGNVGIGTAAQTSYRLAVDGHIHTKEVKVDLSDWADYVFEKEYTLPTLEEVKRHINAKGHLINMPSAEEVKANGIELGEMNKLLLEKIEELTLYLLQQQNKIGQLQKESQELPKLKEAINLLENRLKNLEK